MVIICRSRSTCVTSHGLTFWKRARIEKEKNWTDEISLQRARVVTTKYQPVRTFIQRRS